MRALVIYDTVYGNTKQIAEAIASSLNNKAELISVYDLQADSLKDIELLIVGSPINGWQPTSKINEFLASLQPEQLKGVKAASFDTRVNIFFHGDAAQKIAKKLGAAGAQIISEPGLFYVQGKEGPLRENEIEKAKNWTKSLQSSLLINSK